MLLQKIKKILSDHQGITLVEVLVTLFIIGTTLIGVFSFISRSANIAVTIRNNYIASGLTQEGMEIIRNIRDNDFIASVSFGSSLPDGDYIVQWNSQSLLAANPALPPLINLASNSGIYSYDAGTPSIFRRLITISTPRANIERKIIVTVSWREHSFIKSISAENHLFNWKQ